MSTTTSTSTRSSADRPVTVGAGPLVPPALPRAKAFSRPGAVFSRPGAAFSRPGTSFSRLGSKPQDSDQPSNPMARHAAMLAGPVAKVTKPGGGFLEKRATNEQFRKLQDAVGKDKFAQETHNPGLDKFHKKHNPMGGQAF